MIETDNAHTKLNFWLAWLFANAIGLGLAWSIGELIGRQVAGSIGWKFGQLIGIIVFEGILWIARGTVLLRVQSYQALKSIEILIWVSTEIFGWVVSEFPSREDSLMGITAGANFAASLGAMAWIIFWLIKIPKPRSNLWAIQAFLWTFFGLIGGSVLISLIQVTSLVIGETLARLYLPVFGMAVAGVVSGALLGSVTGLALIKLMRWQTIEG